jgi:hypothetical protein
LVKSDPELELREKDVGEVEDSESEPDWESDDEEESWKWWNYQDDQTYFVLATKYKADY